MISSGLTATYDVNGLTAKIFSTVQNIKAQEQGFSQAVSQKENTFSGFTLHNYAVSYLEPKLVYSLHHMLSEAPEGPREQPTHKGLNPNQGEETKTLGTSEEHIEKINFASELDQSSSKADYAKVSAIYQQAVGVNNLDVTLLFEGKPVDVNPSRYAAEAYTTAANLNKQPEPLIELMHDYNRNFDYKI